MCACVCVCITHTRTHIDIVAAIHHSHITVSDIPLHHGYMKLTLRSKKQYIILYRGCHFNRWTFARLSDSGQRPYDTHYDPVSEELHQVYAVSVLQLLPMFIIHYTRRRFESIQSIEEGCQGQLSVITTEELDGVVPRDRSYWDNIRQYIFRKSTHRATIALALTRLKKITDPYHKYPVDSKLHRISVRFQSFNFSILFTMNKSTKCYYDLLRASIISFKVFAHSNVKYTDVFTYS